MKRRKEVSIKDPFFLLDSDVTYTRVDSYYGRVTKDLKMHIMYPKGFDESYPCILLIFGGGWVSLDASAQLPSFVDLVGAGYVVASMEYRLSNEAQYPRQLHDVSQAIRFLKENASRYNIDASKVGVMGISAGGYHALMAGLVPSDDLLRVQSIVAQSAPTDLQMMAQGPYRHLFEALINDPALYHEASPISHVKGGEPPILLIYGTDDEVVPIAQAEAMYDALLKAGSPVELIEIAMARHSDLHFFQKEILTEIRNHFDKTLKNR